LFTAFNRSLLIASIWQGATPLHYAAACGLFNEVEILLGFGASPDLNFKKVKNASAVAEKCGFFGLAAELWMASRPLHDWLKIYAQDKKDKNASDAKFWVGTVHCKLYSMHHAS
jgi:ankyrin repeat protein